MQIDRIGSGRIDPAPERSFTGEVLLSGYFQRSAPSRLSGATVICSPGSRTPWKVNANGQTLIVVDGVGWAHREGGQIVEMRAGDLVWCPPGERHWDGATPDEAVTYVALHEGVVQFLDAVTDAEYLTGKPSTGT